MALLALGIYVLVENTFDTLMLGTILTNPAIIITVLGGLLFIIGFCGCIGALLELFFLLVIVRTHTHTHRSLGDNNVSMLVVC